MKIDRLIAALILCFFSKIDIVAQTGSENIKPNSGVDSPETEKLIIKAANWPENSDLDKEQGKTETVQIEGFYVSEPKNSLFYEMKENAVLKPMWLEFYQYTKASDSILKILENDFAKGIFLKIKGTKITLEPPSHMPGFEYAIVVKEILFVDPKQTLSNFSGKRH